MEKVIFNIKKDVVKTCPIIENGKAIESINFIDYLKTLCFSDVYHEIKKKGCCKKDFLKISFNTESELRRAVKQNSGSVEFLQRRGYFAVVLTF